MIDGGYGGGDCTRRERYQPPAPDKPSHDGGDGGGYHGGYGGGYDCD